MFAEILSFFSFQINSSSCTDLLPDAIELLLFDNNGEKQTSSELIPLGDLTWITERYQTEWNIKFEENIKYQIIVASHSINIMGQVFSSPFIFIN